MRKLMLLAIAPLLLGCAGSAEEAQTPQSCIDALDAAEALVSGPVVEQSEDSIVLIGLIPEAFTAGLNVDNAAADSIIETMNEVNARTVARNEVIEDIVTEYNEASEECRNDSGGAQAVAP